MQGVGGAPISFLNPVLQESKVTQEFGLLKSSLDETGVTHLPVLLSQASLGTNGIFLCRKIYELKMDVMSVGFPKDAVLSGCAF